MVIDHGLLLSWDCKYDREQYYLDLLKPEYNCSKDARSGLSATLWTEEKRKTTSEKVSRALKGKIPKNLEEMRKGRWKAIEELEDGVVVKEYESCGQAGKVLNMDYRLIHNVVKSKVRKCRKYPHKTWRYKHES